ncbi:hypothetical protein [Moraxella equi]|nr:hypothetical protein [Moraxella equi]
MPKKTLNVLSDLSNQNPADMAGFFVVWLYARLIPKRANKHGKHVP